MSNFTSSTTFSETTSSLQELINKSSKSQIWEQGALHAYALAIRCMVQAGVGTHRRIAQILDETEETVFKLYNLPPNATKL